MFGVPAGKANRRQTGTSLTEAFNFKDHYKRLKFSLKKSDYDDLMNKIRTANSAIKDLTGQSLYIEARQVEAKSNKLSVPNFGAIKRKAEGFYSALSTSWECKCRAQHTVNLRLESRLDSGANDEEDEEQVLSPFHVVFRYGYGHSTGACTTSITAPWNWDEAEVRVVTEALPPATAVVDTRIARFKRKVRFPSQLARATVQAARQPVPCTRPITDLCSAIGTLQSSQRDVCLTLFEKKVAKQKYGLEIIPIKSRPNDTDLWSVSTLGSALQSGHQFPKRDRLRLAVTLASSVLQLHETPWLGEDWGVDNIYFLERPGTNAYDHCFVFRQFDQDHIVSKKVASRSVARVIRNSAVFALGIALIELWYARTLAELQIPADEEQIPDKSEAELLTRYNTAQRLVEELEDQAGTKYSGAVRRCIYCNFDTKVNRLEDDKFQKAVFQGVVVQLQENYKFMVVDDEN